MSRSLNKVILIGNLGADPEVRSTSNGSRVATLSLATSRQWKNQSGEKQEKTEWHRVVLWNNKGSSLADLAEKFCKKGDKIYIEGSIEYRSWQDREGQTRYTTEITAREVILLSGKSGEGSDFSPANKVGAAAASASGGKARKGSRTSPRRSTPRTTTSHSDQGMAGTGPGRPSGAAPVFAFSRRSCRTPDRTEGPRPAYQRANSMICLHLHCSPLGGPDWR